MPSYSPKSLKKLSECHQDIRTIFHYVIKYWDNTVVTGHRSEAEQQDKFDRGLSQVVYPNSKHNSIPSMAIDSVPFPTLYSSRDNMIAYGGFVMGVAEMLYAYGDIEHKLRWGHDWDQDDRLDDETFEDTGHFELYKPI